MRFLLILFFLPNVICAQDVSKVTLKKMEDEALLSLFNEVEFDSLKAEKVARVYLERARKEKDTIKMARGYDRLARIFHPQKNIQFADSVIHLTKDIKNITYPGLGYIQKATEFYYMGDIKMTFKYFLEAYNYSMVNDNKAHQVFISDNLIYLKIFWGDKKEALTMQKRRHRLVTQIDFYNELKRSTRKGAEINVKDLYIENELYSLSNFILCYTELKKLDSAQHYLDLSYKKLKEYKGTPSFKNSYELRLPVNSAEINFFKENYETSLDTIDLVFSKLKPHLRGEKLMKNLYLFKGLNLYELNEKAIGITFLKKADSILNLNKNSLVPYHRLIYEKLLDYYSHEKKDNNKKLEYLEKLIELDSIIKENFLFFDSTLIKEFENPELFKEKEELIRELKNENLQSKSFLWITLSVLSTCLIIIVLYQRKQRVYKSRFKELVKKNNENDKNGNERKLSSEIYNEILLKLEDFEEKKGFLKNDITINSLSKTLGTNQKYLSKVINIEKGNNFSQYLNELRVAYVFNELQTNENLRNFTIKAIAIECGFKNAESFSKAFFKKYKIKPSFYLKQLRKGEST